MKKIHEVFAPSNIAILKYWGKVNGQYPLNPSISFTLKNAKTKIQASVEIRSDKEIKLNKFVFEGKENVEFADKLAKKIKKVFTKINYPFGVDLEIVTQNTFPHSSGIASSASSMAAVAKLFAEIFSIKDINEQSSIAREFSGSASRSLSDGWSLWGKTPTHEKSSQDFAINISESVHPEFQTLQDWIFVCGTTSKAVSSSEGHERMEQHSFRKHDCTMWKKEFINF